MRLSRKGLHMNHCASAGLDIAPQVGEGAAHADEVIDEDITTACRDFAAEERRRSKPPPPTRPRVGCFGSLNDVRGQFEIKSVAQTHSQHRRDCIRAHTFDTVNRNNHRRARCVPAQTLDGCLVHQFQDQANRCRHASTLRHGIQIMFLDPRLCRMNVGIREVGRPWGTQRQRLKRRREASLHLR